ncbi:hypothetical protein JCM12178A_08330 [Salidesulfovibrio brasiliensis]
MVEDPVSTARSSNGGSLLEGKVPASWHEPFELYARRRRASKPYETTLTLGFRAGESPFGVLFQEFGSVRLPHGPVSKTPRKIYVPQNLAGRETPIQIKPSRKRYPKGERQTQTQYGSVVSRGLEALMCCLRGPGCLFAGEPFDRGSEHS